MEKPKIVFQETVFQELDPFIPVETPRRIESERDLSRVARTVHAEYEGCRERGRDRTVWFDSWADFMRVPIIGTAAYAALVVVLRVFGKRTLSQFSAFDFVVTVALGSTLATILLSSDVSWLEGTAAFAILAILQFLIALLTSRWKPLFRLVTSPPSVLLTHGEIQWEAIRANRMTESELLSAIRGSGIGDVSRVGAVVLESNGKLSVIPESQYGDGSALGDLSPES